MSQVRDLLVSSARSIFETTVTKDVIDAVEAGRFPEHLWQAIEDSGLDLALVPEEKGGAGVSCYDAAAILRVAGAAAAPAPLADSMIARRLLAACGLEADPGPLALAQVDDGEDGATPRVERSGEGFRLDGEVRAVPFARHAVAIVVPVVSPEGPRLAVVTRGRAALTEDTNLAGEPRDTVRFDGVALEPAAVSPASHTASAEHVRRLGAFTRAALMSGALEHILAITVEYARERIQFGRAIGQFQAIQQELAVLAGETAAAQAAADAAAAAIDAHDGTAALAVAVAKMRVGEAAGRGSKVAHQVHGAIGFTHEHELHYRTRRLWAWRDECGSETWWAERVGEAVLARGAEGLWPLLTSSSAARSAAR
ncbi:MAG TPA: acyl-CoA dehydrogenase family protein [Thermoanaerobaculia bacterium]|nr:acyl-CoA dehydrogenase family protein [Thermoanaerobaculia bacterium]